MRGRANDPVVRRAKARRHAERAHYCSCGKVVWGNGGKSSHAAMHARKGDGYVRGVRPDGHGYISRDAFHQKFPAAETTLPHD